MTTRSVYISGPMTGMPDYNFPAFNEAATQLRLAGFPVENPADKGKVPGWEWADYLRSDLAVMAMSCDRIFQLDGWRKSRGARLEDHVARELGFLIVVSDGAGGFREKPFSQFQITVYENRRSW